MNPDNYDRLSLEDLPVGYDDSIGENVVSLTVASFEVNRRDSIVSPFQVRLWFDTGEELQYWETLLDTDQTHDLRTKSSRRKLANTARRKLRDRIDDSSLDVIADIRLLPDVS